MNIFKILGSADGHIYEPSINAFLAYLLDPYANHGFEDRIFKKFLTAIKHPLSASKNFPTKNFTTNSSEYEIFIEPEYGVEFDLKEANSKKQYENKDIDIYVKILAKTDLADMESEDSDPEIHFIIIENKIRKSLQPDQLIKEWVGFKDHLKNRYEGFNPDTLGDNQTISFVYVTPDTARNSKAKKTYSSQFSDLAGEMFQEGKPIKNQFAIHLNWKPDGYNSESLRDMVKLFEYSNNSISSIIRQVLIEENLGISSGIYEYSKHTLKGFLDFVENDFKANKKPEPDGKAKFYKSFSELKDSGALKTLPAKHSLRMESLYSKLKDIYHYAKVYYTKTHPASFKFITNGKLKKMFSLSFAYGGSLDLITRNMPNHSQELLLKELENIGIEPIPYDGVVRIPFERIAKDEDVMKLIAIGTQTTNQNSNS